MMGQYQAECDYQLALLNSNKRIEQLREENAELKRWNANLKTENFKLSQEAATILGHCKVLERIIAESQKQERERIANQFDEAGWHPYAEFVRKGE